MEQVVTQKDQKAIDDDTLQTANLKKMLIKDYNVYSKLKFKTFVRKLIKFTAYLVRHDISLPEALCLPIYNQPHFHVHSKEFFINARQLNIERCRELIAQDHILVHQIDFMGKTALQWGVIKRSTDLVKLFLENRADPEMLDFTGKSALTYAIVNDDEAIIKVGVRHQASLGPQDDSLERWQHGLPGVHQERVD